MTNLEESLHRIGEAAMKGMIVTFYAPDRKTADRYIEMLQKQFAGIRVISVVDEAESTKITVARGS